MAKEPLPEIPYIPSTSNWTPVSPIGSLRKAILPALPWNLLKGSTSKEMREKLLTTSELITPLRALKGLMRPL